MRNRKKIIIISIIVTIILITSIILTIFIINKNKKQNDEVKKNLEEIENNFYGIFTNSIYPKTDENKGKLQLKYNLEKDETGKYKIDINIPSIEIKTEVVKKINDEIYISFIKPILEIMNGERAYTIYNADYVAYINNNILSVVIRCNLKEGSNAQKMIIRTYNYDMENDKILTLSEILSLKNLNQEEIQNKILEKINLEIQKVSAIQNSGYNIYKRDINNSMYKIENTKQYFLGENNILYIIYCYGNNEYTSELDLAIFE